MEGKIPAPAIAMANLRLLHLLSRFQDVSPYVLGALFIDGGVYGRHSPS